MGIPTRECFDADHPAEPHHHAVVIHNSPEPLDTYFRHRHPACPWDCHENTYVQTTAGNGRRPDRSKP